MIHTRFRAPKSMSSLSLPRLFLLVIVFISGWMLSGCSRSPGAGRDSELVGGNEPAEQADSSPRPQDASRVDRQGAVEFVVTPMDTADGSEELLRFDVSMNTHSVDISMDLAQLSTLATDLGLQIDADSWTGGSGHHVSGQLIFPMRIPDGSALLEGAQEITLTIRDIDAPERVFRWQISEIP
jgi:hypothetical protein